MTLNATSVTPQLTNPRAPVHSPAPAEAGDFNELHRVFGISRTRGYLLGKAGHIRLFHVSRRRTLVDFNSVREYLASLNASV